MAQASDSGCFNSGPLETVLSSFTISVLLSELSSLVPPKISVTSVVELIGFLPIISYCEFLIEFGMSQQN